MRKYQKEIIKLTSEELFFSLFDLITPFFEASRLYRQSTREYLRQRQCDRTDFFNKIRYWRRQGYIELFVEGKDKYVELTKKGKEHLQKISLHQLTINRPMRWDGKWRVVIFDVPEEQKAKRNILRTKLKELGFYQIQKSIYVYPFECTNEISLLSKRLYLGNSVLIMISEIIQGEKKIIKSFLNKDILEESD